MFCRLRWVRRGCAQWPQDARGSAVRAVWSGAAASSEHRSSSAASTQGKTQRQDQDPERLYRTDENMFKLLVTHEPSARQKRRYSGTWDWHLRMLLISLVPLAMSVLLERYIRHFLDNNQEWQEKKTRMGLGDPLKFERRVEAILGDIAERKKSEEVTSGTTEGGAEAKDESAAQTKDTEIVPPHNLTAEEIERLESLRADMQEMWKHIERLDRMHERLAKYLDLRNLFSGSEPANDEKDGDLNNQIGNGTSGRTSHESQSQPESVKQGTVEHEEDKAKAAHTSNASPKSASTSSTCTPVEVQAEKTPRKEDAPSQQASVATVKPPN
ncbi:hypothetical protein FVE85_7603 [Porphyridium purpureum]|uniref:Uncharacterized protein n=1 Tax=Porphyridium purpureum TaxID=35688 RepID=A0A5J4ZAB3_PORPP|nr:hypothetical protein FVE85_7603 [Porphyridium purpureum]|eukprot:POR7915..scf295_1